MINMYCTAGINRSNSLWSYVPPHVVTFDPTSGLISFPFSQVPQVPVALVSPLDHTRTQANSSTLPLLTIPSLTVSSMSLRHLKDKLTHVVQSRPTETSKYLEWVLGVVHDSIIYSQ